MIKMYRDSKAAKDRYVGIKYVYRYVIYVVLKMYKKYIIHTENSLSPKHFYFFK